MYHQSRKQRYFKERQLDQNTRITQLFERLGQYEEQYGKDLCEMNMDELLAIMKNHSFSTALYIRSQINDYNSWCLGHHYISINYADPKFLTRNILKEINETTLSDVYLSIEEAEQCRKILAATRASEVLLPVFMAVYEGVTRNNFDDLIYLRRKDIDPERCVVRTHRGKDIVVSEMLVHLLLQCEEAKSEKVGKYSEKKYIDSLFPDSIFKLTKEHRPMSKIPVMKRRLRIYMEKISEYTGIHLSISELSNSGIFNYVYEQGMIRYGINLMTEIKMGKMPEFSRRVYDSLLEEKGIDYGIYQYRLSNKFINRM